jgi:hypothetical protein
MKKIRRQLRPAVLAATMLVAMQAGLVLCGCRRGGRLEDVKPPPIKPYHGYFQAQLGEDVYLFATLYEKLRFDRDPAALTYDEMISRTGQRVMISNAHPDLVKRIEAGYEQAVDTELMAAGQPGAPPAATPPTPTTRQIRASGATAKPLAGSATGPATSPATRPSTTAVDRLGPSGNPPQRD